MTDLTPEQQKRLSEIARKFKLDMQKTGLGVTIQVPGREPVVITEPPRDEQRTDD